MKAQFLHVNYAKRVREGRAAHRRSVEAPHGTFRSAGWSAADLLAEMARLPEHCSHVAYPQSPILHFGVPPMEVLDIVEEWVRAQHERSKTKENPRGRRYPKNRPVLAAGVISYPREDLSDWPEFRQACIDWLKQRYGARLRCVVEHSDEAHPHLHYILSPLNNEGMEAVHEGYAAQLQRRRAFHAETGRRGKGERLGTYRVAAMRQLQDTFHAEVAQYFGLARTGPRRERTSYEQARQRQRKEQEEAEQLAFVQWQKERALAEGLAGSAWPDNRENALWQLARDTVNTVWKIGAASHIAAVQEAAEELVARYNALAGHLPDVAPQADAPVRGTRRAVAPAPGQSRRQSRWP